MNNTVTVSQSLAHALVTGNTAELDAQFEFQMEAFLCLTGGGYVASPYPYDNEPRLAQCVVTGQPALCVRVHAVTLEEWLDANEED